MKWQKLLFIIFFCCSTITVYGNSYNTLSIHLKELETVKKDVEFELHKVGSMEGGAPRLDSCFSWNSFPEKAWELERAAAHIAEHIRGQATVWSQTDEGGRLFFRNLENGVYLVKQRNEKDYGKVAPFLVWFPYGEEEKCSWLEVEPKAVKPSDQESLKEPEKTSFPVETGDNTDGKKYINGMIGSALVCCLGILRKVRR